ncbi:hypothetical protein DUNSADRAFT_8187 [Dunaliella salina]|uniref:Uncharacterized protein n=1 Tax=Dunaliella salina TaxID=3046 RepID=A0ABQ7FUB8_DUNSA|nr:hypothetical protein DUNSADRAFT_8187 [Dunaliella salina]|eukprot:KAF5825597.1 hypothetical protein DUNSADRAFT_8187 [Dunaliella salina]
MASVQTFGKQVAKSCAKNINSLPLGRVPTTRSTRSTVKRMSVAVKATDQQVPFVIVGGGRVGEALANMGGNIDTIVRRGEKVPDGEAGTPIIVCTRNDDLASVVQVTPENRRKGGWQLFPVLL